MRRSIAVLLLVCSAAFSQVAEKANTGYKTKEGRANVARNLSNPERDARQKPADLVRIMDLKPGMTVADLGTGVGYMLPWLSQAVGPAGKVLAQDIHQDFLDAAGETARSKGLANVSYVLGTERDSKLPERCCDAVLVLDAYHHFDYPEPMLASIRKGLKPDGRMVIVDFYKRPNAMPGGRALEHIRLDMDDAIREIEANGFRLLSKGEQIPESQWYGIFGVK
ncbi:MAG: methyltransferase domain-containing protein [Bryobacteraceae bacterium]